jgi:uncharacterized membrane protein YeaQ/YmgE (transglycosylase-associated protein family)
MNVVLWILAGATVGWIGYSVLGLNKARGMMISLAIGTIGGLIGGKMVAPVFYTVAATGAFSMPALLVAATVALALLVIGNLVQDILGF